MAAQVGAFSADYLQIRKRGEKRAQEESLENSITKRQQLEEKLDDTERSYKYKKRDLTDSKDFFVFRFCLRLRRFFLFLSSF